MTDTRPPLIGITTYLEQAQMGVWDTRAAYLPHHYIDAITIAGGVAVLLPPQPVVPGAAERVLEALDGLVVAGGKDVDPARYGQEPHPANDDPRTDRDAWEDALLAAAIARKQPFLGICRGAQLLNVSLGGTLHQHLPDVIGTDRYSGDGSTFKDNEVEVSPDSRVARYVGAGTLPVKSYHHQAIDEVADGLVVTARTEEGVVQAVELPTVPFGIGVQWHPEQAAQEDARLFAGLIGAAREYARAR